MTMVSPESKDPLTSLSLEELARFTTQLHGEAAQMAKASNEAATAYRQRFRFSLAIGNGAGLIYVGAMITAERSMLPWWHVLPSAWLFVAGAIAGSLMLLIASLSSTARAGRWTAHTLAPVTERIEEAQAELNELGIEIDVPIAQPRALEEKLARRADTYGVLAFILEVFSAAAFACGVMYPLVILTSRAFGH